MSAGAKEHPVVARCGRCAVTTINHEIAQCNEWHATPYCKLVDRCWNCETWTDAELQERKVCQ